MSTTLDALWQALGHALGDVAVYTVSGGSTSSAAINDLISGAASPSTFLTDACWVYNETKRIQRQARPGTFVPSTGTIPIDPPWTSPAANDHIILSKLFPMIDPVRTWNGANYLDIINHVLSMLILPDRITVPITGGAQSFSLDTWKHWLDREDRLGWPALPDGTPQPRILEPGPTGGTPIPADWRRPHLRLDAESPYLEIEAPFAVGTTGVITLNVQRPANTWVFQAGSWIESTTGLVNSTDATQAAQNDVVTVGAWLAAEILAAEGVTSATGRWADHVERYKADAMGVARLDRTQMQATVQAMTQKAA